MIDVVKALDQKVIRLVHIRVQPGAGLDEAAGEFTLVSRLFLGEEKSRLFAFRRWPLGALCRRLFCGWSHGQILAENLSVKISWDSTFPLMFWVQRTSAQADSAERKIRTLE